MNRVDEEFYKPDDAIRILDAKEFHNSVNVPMPTIVAFTAAWAGPCRQLIPIMDELALEFKNKAIVAILNVDQSPDVAQEFGVRNVPTVLYFDSNGNEVITFECNTSTRGTQDVGLFHKENYQNKIDELIFKNEPKPTYDIEPFEIIKQRFITRVRRFRVTENDDPFQLHKGDILEEIFNQPNYFYNLNRFDRIKKVFVSKTMKDAKPSLSFSINLQTLNKYIKDISKEQSESGYNAHRHSHDIVKLALSFEEMETIDVKESETFKLFSKKAASSYRAKLKSLGNIHEDLTALRYMLNIGE